MKTIIQGDRDILKEYKYFKCNHCGWTGKAEKKEYKSYTQYNVTDYFVNCLCCGRAAYEIKDRKVLEDVINMENKISSEDYWENR